jgi:hypothetical protein
MNLSVLVHTFSKYSFLWEGMVRDLQRNWPDRSMLYFGTDIPCENDVHFYNLPNRTILYSGRGEWSNRLIALLRQIPTEYVLYLQEDHYIKKPPPLSEAMQIMTDLELLRLQISPVIQYYSLESHGNTLFFHNTSKYLVSHQPSIWKKSFLLECLRPGQNPWQNEYAGTRRLNKRPEFDRKIAIYPYDWYKHKCVKGKVAQV